MELRRTYRLKGVGRSTDRRCRPFRPRRPEPDAGLVQLHGVSSTGAKEWHHLDAGAVLGQCLDFPCIGFRS